MRRVLTILLLATALAAPATAHAATGNVAIFFYPWWSNVVTDGAYAHWQQGGHAPPLDLTSSFYPARGAYSDGSPATLDAQMKEIRAAGVDQVVSSWWGWGSPTDVRLPDVIRAARAHGLSVAVQLEPYIGRTADSTVADVAHLQTLGIAEFYVYEPEDFPDGFWAQLNDSLRGSARMYAQTGFAGLAAAGHFAGLYTYDVLVYSGSDFARICAEAHAARLACLPSVGPGYDARRATGDMRVRPRRDGATYDSMWIGAIAAGADAVTITSYNEWHEGTQIEPAIAATGGDGFRYSGYSGAWGIVGRRARTAYLDRTAYWAARYRAQKSSVASRLR